MFKQKFPLKPGVYWFLNKSGKVIYVGKAKNLKHRILSYRKVTADAIRTQTMLTRAVKLKWRPTDSEWEALLVEAELIKLHQPHYNVLLKDDKSPLYIIFTKEDYPRVLTARRQDVSGDYYGPYPSGWQAKRLLSWLRHLFPFCNATLTQKRKHEACFYYHLKLCPGACVGQISPTAYRQSLTKLKLLLSGKKKTLIRELKKEIRELSRDQKFEQAIEVRDQLTALTMTTPSLPGPELNLPILESDRHLDQTKHLRHLLKPIAALPSDYQLSRIEAYDISNLQGRQATGSMVVFINGRPAKEEYRLFKIRTVPAANDPAMIKEVIARRVKHREWGLPNLMIIDGGRTQLTAAISVLPWDIPIVGIAKHPDKLVVYNRNSHKFERLSLPSQNPATKLIQALRDESHRFAKKYHHKLRAQLLHQ